MYPNLDKSGYPVQGQPVMQQPAPIAPREW